MRKVLAVILLLPVAGYLGLRWYLHHRVAQMMDQAIAGAAPFAAIAYQGTIADLDGTFGVRGLSVEPTVAGPGTVRIDELVVRFGSLAAAYAAASKSAADGSVPETLGFGIHGLRAELIGASGAAAVKAPDGNPLTELDRLETLRCGKIQGSAHALQALGYGTLVPDLDLDYRIVAEQRTVEMHIDGTARDAFAMRIEVTGVADGDFSAPAELVQREVVARRGRLRIEDLGYYAKLNALCASREGLAPAAWLDAHMAAIGETLAARGIVASPDLLDGYRRFRGAPGSYEMSFENRELYTAQRLALWEPDDAMRLIGLRVAFNDAPVADLSLKIGAPPPVAEPAEAVAEAPPPMTTLAWNELGARRGQWVTVTLKDGRQHVGILREASPYQLTIEKRLSGGMFMLPIDRVQVASVQSGR